MRLDGCEDIGHTGYVLVTHSSHVNNKLFEATIVRMVQVVPGSAQPPFLVRYDCEEVPTGLWPRIGSETDLARRLLARSPRWEMYQAVNARMDLVSANRVVTAMEPLPYEALLQREDKQNET